MSSTNSNRPYKGRNSYQVLNDYTVVDIETTGLDVNNCEVIELAAVRVRNGEIVDTFNSLVKPNGMIPVFIEFLTGITNDMLTDAPLPDKAFHEFAAFLGDDTLVGHNIVSFDSCVLYDYFREILGLSLTNQLVDTLYFARKCDFSPENYKLPTLAEYFGITYDPHRALNDCLTNYKIYEHLKPLLDKNKVKKESSNGIHNKKALSESTIALAELSAMCRTLTAGKSVSDEQILELQKWMNDNLYLAGNYPFDILFSKIDLISQGGVISDDGRKEFFELMRVHADPVKNKSDNSKVDLSGKRVCLTGEFDFGSRDYVTEALKSRNVIISGSVTSKTDYLIVGGEGSSAWACGNYGTKVKKALELQEKGIAIKIIRENVMTAWLEDSDPEFEKLMDRIQSEVNKLSTELDLPKGFLTIVDKKNGEKSLWIVEPVSNRKSKMILNVSEKGKQGSKYLSVTVKAAKISGLQIPDHVEILDDNSDPTVSYLNFSQSNDGILLFLIDLIRQYVVEFEPSDRFGCCHRYKECSDAGKCIHPDQFYAKACWYRKNLEAGKIFY